MIVNEQTDNNGTYLEIEREGHKYRTESFTSLASLYTNLPQPLYLLKTFNYDTPKKFGILDLSNVGTYRIKIL